MEIRLLENNNIDKKAWDKCMLESPGFELYMRSSYLDIAFPKWKAIVAGNYQAVYPIFEKKLLFVKSLGQPLFTGPFIVAGNDNKAIQSILNYLPQLFQKYQKLDLFILNDITNLDNTYVKQIRKFQRMKVPEEGFIPDGRLKKNLKKAEKSQLKKLLTLNPDDFVQGIKEHLLSAHNALNSSGLQQLHKIIKYKDQFGGECIGIANNENDLQAAQFFLRGDNRLYIILSFSTGEGRKNSALHSLQTKLINKHLHSSGFLHFGGSNIERVAEYNHNYGAEDISYIRVSRKKFPFTLLKN